MNIAVISYVSFWVYNSYLSCICQLLVRISGCWSLTPCMYCLLRKNNKGPGQNVISKETILEVLLGMYGGSRGNCLLVLRIQCA